MHKQGARRLAELAGPLKWAAFFSPPWPLFCRRQRASTVTFRRWRNGSLVSESALVARKEFEALPAARLCS